MAATIGEGENVVRLQRFRKLWRHWPALALSYARARGQQGENELDQRDRGLVASRQPLTVKHVEVDGVPRVMHRVSGMDTASDFLNANPVTIGTCGKQDLE